jgi:hypothetical protein
MRFNPYNIGQPQHLYESIPMAGGDSAAAKRREARPDRPTGSITKSILEGTLVVGMFTVIIVAILAVKLAIWMPFIDR